MKSQEIFPIKLRNDVDENNWVEMTTHINGVYKDHFYVDSKSYCRLKDALSAAETEIEDLKKEIELLKSINSTSNFLS